MAGIRTNGNSYVVSFIIFTLPFTTHQSQDLRIHTLILILPLYGVLTNEKITLTGLTNNTCLRYMYTLTAVYHILQVRKQSRTGRLHVHVRFRLTYALNIMVDIIQFYFFFFFFRFLFTRHSFPDILYLLFLF